MENMAPAEGVGLGGLDVDLDGGLRELHIMTA